MINYTRPHQYCFCDRLAKTHMQSDRCKAYWLEQQDRIYQPHYVDSDKRSALEVGQPQYGEIIR